MKRPSFQFYPGDWLRSTDLQSCSIAARGLWIEMMCLMHEGTPYGHLRVGTKVITEDNLAVMVGVNRDITHSLLLELEESGVLEKDGDGCIFCRRMVRDEKTRLKRSECGTLGGNPALVKTTRKDNHHVNLVDKVRLKQSVADAEAEEDADGIDIQEGVQGEKPLERCRTIPPLIEDVYAEGIRIMLPKEQCDLFFNHYESNGWMAGRVKMKKWTAALIKWKSNFNSGVYSHGTTGTKGNSGYQSEADRRREAQRAKEFDESDLKPKIIFSGGNTV